MFQKNFKYYIFDTRIYLSHTETTNKLIQFRVQKPPKIIKLQALLQKGFLGERYYLIDVVKKTDVVFILTTS